MSPKRHLIIPDTQCRPGVPLEHLRWLGKYIAHKQPEVIVHLGDHYDMPSLSSYDKGKKSFQGRRYQADIAAGNRGMDLLMAPIHDLNDKRRRDKKALYKPRQVFLLGNHEERIDRAIQLEPELLDGTIGYEHFNLKQHGWEVHDFLEPVAIDGITYSHYFYNPRTGRPYGGMISTMIKQVGYSFTQGHRQGKEIGEIQRSNGRIDRGLIVGSFYQHDEEYAGPQGNEYWRGVIMKHEVKDGNYDLMEVSLDFLRRRYANT